MKRNNGICHKASIEGHLGDDLSLEYFFVCYFGWYLELYGNTININTSRKKSSAPTSMKSSYSPIQIACG
jgi:hypothetical protein